MCVHGFLLIVVLFAQQGSRFIAELFFVLVLLMQISLRLSVVLSSLLNRLVLSVEAESKDTLTVLKLP